MRARRILVVTKRSLLETSVETIPDKVRANILRRDIENRQSIYDVFQALARRKVSFEIISRHELRKVSGVDLVVAVGGDGTFLATSHVVGSTPILAVNSDPEGSVALFTCCDRHTFGGAFDAAQAGKLGLTRLNRMKVSVSGRPLGFAATNDVLFTHRNPAQITRYCLRVGRRWETQRSSGVWISTAAGSTGAVLSAGGRRMPIESRDLQFVVREPFALDGPYRMLHGITREALHIEARTPGMALWIDGAAEPIDVPAGDRVAVRSPGPVLKVLGYSEKRRSRFIKR